MPDPDDVPRPWLDAYPPGVPGTYRWPDVTLSRFLADAARDFPDVPAVRTGTGTWSWRQVEVEADRFAGALGAAGLAPGDRVAVSLRNGPAAVVALFGTWQAGGVVVLLDPDLPPDARRAAVAATRPAVALVGADHRAAWEGAACRVVSVAPWGGRGRLARGWQRVRRAATRDRQDEVPDVAPVDWATFVATASPTATAGIRTPADPAVLAPTTDARGRRHVVTLSHANLVANAVQARLWVPDVQAGREVLLAAVPFTHLFGLTVGLLATTLSAGTLAVADGDDPRSLLACIDRTRPTLLPSEPGLLGALVDEAEHHRTDLSCLRACLVGGDPLDHDVSDRLRALSGEARVRRGFGVAEAGPLTHANPVYGRASLDQIGLPVTGTTAAVVDLDDPTRLLPPGEAGRLAVAGPQVMTGYWEDPAATAAVLRDGWLLTDHRAVRDAGGAFAILGRVGDTGTAKEVAP